MDGFPFDISGTKDIREADSIRDTKTASKSPSTAETMQMACYALNEKIERKAYPKKVCIDALVKTKVPKLVTKEAVPSDKMIQPFLRRMERVAEIIESAKKHGTPLPAADSNHWICTKKFCGYATTCEFWSGR